MTIVTERVYAFKDRSRGKREFVVLVDRVWPRGIRKETLGLDAWAKELAPSTELRKWFGHDRTKWSEFVKRYRKELSGQEEALDRLWRSASGGKLVLLFGARDETHNQAVVLRELLEKRQETGDKKSPSTRR